MENTITITPANHEIKVMADTVRIRNQFVNMGFETRSGFIGVVQQINPDYIEYKAVTLLERWWNNRAKSEELNKDLEIVLEKLRHE